ncbi:MAG: M23 family metallopeptidase [Clostridia bacterium]|nr:M23 family metallopeptidase [Clostridia bacterium]
MKKSNGRLIMFMRRNTVYLVLALCIVAVGLSITFMLLSDASVDSTLDSGKNPPVIETPIEPDEPVVKPDDPTEPTEPVIKPITFIMPVNDVTAITEYSESMVFNSTLGHYSAHLAVDFYAPEGTEVVAVYDGTIKSVESSLLKGTTVTIDHGNGLYSVYNSLADGDAVVVGQSVKQGDVIGEVSVTNRQEYKSGAHLHFEVTENGTTIDPAKYLEFDEK